MRLHFEQIARQAERELARRLRATNAAKLFGFTLEAAEPGRAVLRMRVQPRHIQVHGVVHGGILAALADTAGALGIYLMVPRGSRLATIEMKINYLETVAKGVLLAEGKVLRCGRNFAVSECDIHSHDHRLVAKALITYSIGKVNETPRPKKRSRPRS